MAIYEIFSHPVLLRHKASVVSKATLLMLAILALTFIPPLLIVYRSYGFWLREATYREQPDVHFKKDFILILDLQDSDSPVVYSTFQQYNLLLQSQLRISVVKAREDDTNRDGRYDRLNFDIEVPMTGTDSVLGVKLLLFFQYKMRRFSQFTMESLGYIEYSSPLSGAKLQHFGDLRLQQKQLLGHKGIDRRYNVTLVDSASPYAETYSLGSIFQEYNQRNVTTRISNDYSIWMAGRAPGSPFTISTVINYPEEVILYTPGFWYLIKWGWVQYVSVLLLFLFVFHQIKIFIFHHQVVTTVVDTPIPREKTS